MSDDRRDTNGSSLRSLGWTTDLERAFEAHASAGLIAARVVSSGGTTVAVAERGATEVVLQRRFRRSVSDQTDLPAVGDWLALEPLSDRPPQAALRAILPRTGTFTRQRVSESAPQVIAANVDIAFLVSGLDRDLNPRRIERYLVLAREGGVEPVIVLNKVDLAPDLEAVVSAVEAVAAGAPIVAISAMNADGLDQMRRFIGPATTACLLGSSGVGKSTIVNALLGEQRQAVRALRLADSRGRHTTTRRELFTLPGGGLLIDTPGLRTVGVLGGTDAVEGSFADIEAIAASCRFIDCRHDSEPGCAVVEAIDTGTLAAARLRSYRKLEAEQHSAEVRADEQRRRAAERSLGRFYRKAGREAVRLKRGR